MFPHLRYDRGQSAAEFATLSALALAALLLLASFPAVQQAYANVAAAVGALVNPAGMTDHAVDPLAHPGKWNAETVTEYMNQGKCIPVQYSCPALDIDVFYCVMNEKKSIGLIVGHTIRQAVTGFMGNTRYWQDRCGR